MQNNIVILSFLILLVISACNCHFLCDPEYYTDDTGEQLDECYKYYYNIMYNELESEIPSVSSIMVRNYFGESQHYVAYELKDTAQDNRLISDFYTETVFWFETFTNSKNKEKGNSFVLK